MKTPTRHLGRVRVAVAINQLMLSERWYDLPAEDRARLYDALELGRYPEIGKDFAPRLLRALDARRQRFTWDCTTSSGTLHTPRAMGSIGARE